MRAGRAFDLTDPGGLGYIDLFERTSAGYVIVCEDVSVLRIAWFDARGEVIDYVAAPTQRHAEVNPGANVAMGPDGSIYYMASTPEGIEIRRAAAEIIRRQSL
jgi:hypothetical protein